MSVQNKQILGYVRLFIHKNKTEASQKLYRSFREFPHHCSTGIIYWSRHAKTISPDLSGLRTTWFEEYQYTSFTCSRLIFWREKTLSLASPGVVMAAPRRKVSAYDHVLYERWEARTKACKTKWTFATRKKTKNNSAYDIFGNQILSGIQLPP